MNTIQTIHLIYFSPTHTSLRVIENIAKGFENVRIVKHDLTCKALSDTAFDVADLAIVGIPVYAGRLPKLAVERMESLKGNNIPAVSVVVYGNRAYEDALIELQDLITSKGFRPVASAAFIGEHSYSTPTQPIAAHRPDEQDCLFAQKAGKAIAAKLQTNNTDLPLPKGNHPYKEMPQFTPAAPATDANLCIRCGECVAICPAEAIDTIDPTLSDKSKCIKCCACVKFCPQEARTFFQPRAEWLFNNCSVRKEPELYL